MNDKNQCNIENESDKKALRSTRFKLSILFVLSVVPFVLAYVIFFVTPDWIPSSRTNEGVLLLPPIDISALGLAREELYDGDEWLLLLPVGFDCDEDCVELLYLSRQVKTALGKEANRLERVLLLRKGEISGTFKAHLDTEHQGMRRFSIQNIALKNLIGRIVDNYPEGAWLLLMDPNGNIMMLYTLDKAGKPMLKDIKHLLKVSNIG